MEHPVMRGMIPDAWLADAPLFLDETRVNSLYSSLALPEVALESLEANVVVTKSEASGVELGIRGSFGGGLFSSILPVSVEAGAKATNQEEKTEQEGGTYKFLAVTSPESRLRNLIMWFGANWHDRVWSVDARDLAWYNNDEFRSGLPKPLLFLELHPGTPIIPMAAELSDGHVVLFYSALEEKLRPWDPDHYVPYPTEKDQDQTRKFWAWHAEHPKSSNEAMHVIEEQIGTGGRPRWIDYRIPLGDPFNAADSLHFHLRAKQSYDTGDFAYRLCHRGTKHGLRLIGTLKAGPALDVLAVFER